MLDLQRQRVCRRKPAPEGERVYRAILRAAAVLSFVLASVTSARAAAVMCVDSPARNGTVPSSFVVGGWAIDFASRTDTGVSQMHVWAYPQSGAPPVFLGEITHGARPDVAAAYGKQFMQSGFSVTVKNLAPGGYMLVLFPYSSITNAFDYAAAVTVNINVVATAPQAPAPPAAPAAPAAPNTPATPASPTPASSGPELRILQWNTHHGGYGTDGVYSPDRIATWAAKMNPDVIMFNEIERNNSWGNQDQPEVYKGLLQQKTGKTWYYVFAQEFGQWDAKGKGNLILSTYPINVSDRYELMRNADRSIAMATITVNSRDITLINTHLDPYDQALRLAQATEVTTWSAAQPENRIITGDMNAWPDQTSIAQFNRTYQDSWAVAASKGTASAFAGNNGETKNGRIDYIFYSKNSASLSVKSSQVYDTRDSNGATPSDHRPVLTTFIVK
jgi:endonuclease/exonuclease/phosphatase family metal-dependent hydrolase